METVTPDEDPCPEPIYYTFRPGNADELKQCIADAFADAVYPGDDAIIVSGYPGCCAECGETQAFFQGRHWRDLADSDASWLTDWGGLSLLTPDAWRFFLPAYLTAGLSGRAHAEDAMQSALWALTPWPAPGLAALGGGVIDYVKMSEDWFAARAFNFSAAQLDCLAAYTRAAILSDPDDEEWLALAAYWNDRAAAAT